MNSFDQAFQTAAALGVTICCAAGDAGSGDENPDQLAQFGAVPEGLAHADFPGSSPFVLCWKVLKRRAEDGWTNIRTRNRAVFASLACASQWTGPN